MRLYTHNASQVLWEKFSNSTAKHYVQGYIDSWQSHASTICTMPRKSLELKGLTGTLQHEKHGKTSEVLKYLLTSGHVEVHKQEHPRAL